MNKSIKDRLEKEIEDLLIELEGFTPDQKEYTVTMEAINSLYATLNKEKTLELEDRKLSVEYADKDLQLKTLNDSKIWNAAKTGLELVGIVAPLVFYGVWMNRGLQFEEEGSFTSTTFKGLIGKFKPTK